MLRSLPRTEHVIMAYAEKLWRRSVFVTGMLSCHPQSHCGNNFEVKNVYGDKCEEYAYSIHS